MPVAGPEIYGLICLLPRLEGVEGTAPALGASEPMIAAAILLLLYS